MGENNSRLLTTKQAAELLGLSHQSLEMYRYRGTGPRYIKNPGLRGAVRYRESDLQAWIAQREVRPREEAATD